MSDGQLDPRHPDPVSSELERYAREAAPDAPRGLADRVISKVESEPPPRRGLPGIIGFWLPGITGSRPRRRLAWAAVVAATVLLAAGGALAAGELARLVREANVGSSPSPSVVDSLSEPESPSPSLSPTASPSVTPEPSPSASSSASPISPSGGTPPGAASPSASEDDDDSPEPAETSRPSQTPDVSGEGPDD